MKFTKLISSIFIIIIMLTTTILAQQDNMMQKDNMKKNMQHEKMMKIDENNNGVAIEGYDPVSYFTDNKAEKSMADYSYQWMGAKWEFTSKNHMEMFKKNPEKYAPKFGGYCAYAVSKGKLVHSDPQAWTIKDGDLYLNKNMNIRKIFRKNISNDIMKANQNWPKLNMKKMSSKTKKRMK